MEPIAPRVSIIMPLFNMERTLPATLESLRAQTFQDFEVIAVNDASTDNTLQILEQYESLLPLKVLNVEKVGSPSARNLGWEVAQGEYLAFLDGDDIWMPEKLQSHVEALDQNPDAGVAYSLSAYINSDSDIIGFQDEQSPEGEVLKELLLENFIYNGSNILFRRTAAGEGRMPLIPCTHDWIFEVYLAARTRYKLVPIHLVLYRIVQGSISSNLKQVEAQLHPSIDLALSIAPQHADLRRRMEANKHSFLSMLYLERGINRMRGVHGLRHLALMCLKNWREAMNPWNAFLGLYALNVIFLPSSSTIAIRRKRIKRMHQDGRAAAILEFLAQIQNNLKAISRNQGAERS